MKPNKIISPPTIAIVGSPNVGKSSLFNRMAGRRKAIVESKPGITRNRLSADIFFKDKKIRIIDTGGIKSTSKEKIDQLVYKQVKDTVNSADAILFVCDARAGATPVDYHITSLLRKSSKKVFLAVNKMDDQNLEGLIYDFYQLGIGQPYPVSAMNGHGIEALLESMSEVAPSEKEEIPQETQPPKDKITVAVVGRANVGKSSYINSLFEEDVVIVDDIAGTTRDSVDIHFEYLNKIFTLVDTAGMKHKRKLTETVEVFSLARSKESIRKAEVVLVMLDAAEGLCVDDIKIIEYVIENAKPCAIVVNKWDLEKNIKQQDYERALKERLKLLEWIPVVFISCLRKRNLLQALELACALKERVNKSIRTVELNDLLGEIRTTHPHPLIKGRKISINYTTQVQIAPQTFILFCNHPKLVRSDYLKFLENNIRSHFGLFGVPIRFKLKEK